MEEELFGKVDEMLNGLLFQADEIEKQALKALNKWLLQFPTIERDGVQVLANEETIASLMASAKQELERVFKGTGYKSLVSDLFDSYDEIIQNAIDIHGELNDVTFTKAFESRVLSPAKELAVRQASAYLSQASLSAQVVAPLTKVLFEAVQYGYTLSEAQAAIEKRMYFGRYAGQIARDGLFQFDGTVHKAVADEYGLDAIRYVGNTVEDTRGQCAKWISVKKIPLTALTNEIAWAKRSGEYKGRKKSGMIPETNDRNFHVYRGGYNCRHRAIPVMMYEEDWQEYLKRTPSLKSNELTDEDIAFAQSQPTLGKAKTLEEAEKEILNANIEHAYVFKDGKRIGYHKGYRHSVPLGGDYKGAVITHNHPAIIKMPKDAPVTEGISFSLKDILTAHVLELKEIRAVSKMTGKTFILRRSDGKNFEKKLTNKVINTYRKHSKYLDNPFMDLDMTHDEAEMLYQHNAFKNLASKFNYEYDIK